MSTLRSPFCQVNSEGTTKFFGAEFYLKQILRYSNIELMRSGGEILNPFRSRNKLQFVEINLRNSVLSIQFNYRVIRHVPAAIKEDKHNPRVAAEEQGECEIITILE